MGLTEKQSAVIDMLIVSNLSKEAIAKTVGVSAKSVYNWLNKNDEFKAELQRRTDVFNDTRITDAKNKLAIHLENAINNIVEMAEDKSNPKRFECNKYLIDRVLGNTTTKIESNNKIVEEDDKIPDIDSILDDLKEEVVDEIMEDNIVIPKPKKMVS